VTFVPFMVFDRRSFHLHYSLPEIFGDSLPDNRSFTMPFISSKFWMSDGTTFTAKFCRGCYSCPSGRLYLSCMAARKTVVCIGCRPEILKLPLYPPRRPAKLRFGYMAAENRANETDTDTNNTVSRTLLLATPRRGTVSVPSDRNWDHKEIYM
jgi:hypothetical protein